MLLINFPDFSTQQAAGINAAVSFPILPGPRALLLPAQAEFPVCLWALDGRVCSKLAPADGMSTVTSGWAGQAAAARIRMEKMGDED